MGAYSRVGAKSSFYGMRVFSGGGGSKGSVILFHFTFLLLWREGHLYVGKISSFSIVNAWEEFFYVAYNYMTYIPTFFFSIVKKKDVVIRRDSPAKLFITRRDSSSVVIWCHT